MKRFHASGYDVADNLLQAFAGAGYKLEPGDKILDLGCGAGGLVYRLRDLGFDAYGFDIHDRVRYRSPDDRRFFGFIENAAKGEGHSNTLVERERFRIPFEDHFFDVVISTSVLEHVMDLPPVIAETARLLKPDGFAYHLYPNKGVFIEPHMYVPFGDRIQSWWYFYLWALLGVRNEFQQNMTARQVANANVQYCKTGLRYYSRGELFEICSFYFSRTRFVDDLYYPAIRRMDVFLTRLKALKAKHKFKTLSQALKMGSLLTEGPRERVIEIPPGWKPRSLPQRLALKWRNFKSLYTS